MGYCTINFVAFVPLDKLAQTRNWLRKHYEGAVAPREIIQATDASNRAVRYYAFELRVTPEMWTEIRRLLAKPQFSTIIVRASLRGTRKEFRNELKKELDPKGWRIKPSA